MHAVLPGAGRIEPCQPTSAVPWGLDLLGALVPTTHVVGYSHKSLRDKDLPGQLPFPDNDLPGQQAYVAFGVRDKAGEQFVPSGTL